MAAKDLYEKDLYKVLGVSKSDDAAKVKTAYRKLAKDLHPDKTKGNKNLEEKFKEVSEAYEVLSDPKKRAEYEEMREAMSNRGKANRSSNFGFQPGSTSGGKWNGYDDYEDIVKGADYDDIFQSLFGMGAGRQPSRGSDLQTEVEISFREAVLGKELSFKIEHESIKVKIPAGIKDGAKVKIKGRGAEGPAGAGDLFVIVRVTPHPIFSREGNDLLMTLPVTFSEVALGADISIPTFYGKDVTVRIPAGTKNGKMLRIKEKGIKSKNSIGDLLVTLSIQVPQNLSVDASKVLKEFIALSNEESPRKSLKEQVGK